ncbi:hypothetical protein [Sphingorhabdus sp. Alg239-R122]|uniref:hypothetical protein n=1 Tax=Sphingorhabdus sp. Alg239-R122 TaxID=2305989 RepID=UPI0013DD42F9|nr:hypothetical protein [Sphingorhabdus sp. Alg239-R122]
MRNRTLQVLLTFVFCIIHAGPAAAQQTYISKEQQKSLYDAVQDSASDEVSSVISLYSNVLSYKYPKHLVPAFQAKAPSNFMLEFIPFGENIKENWSEMLTIQAFPEQVVRTKSAKEFAVMLAKLVAKSCPNSSIFEDLGKVTLKSGSAHRIIFGCRDVSVVGGQTAGEMTIAQAIKRNGDIVLVQFALRGVPFSKDSLLINEEKRKYFGSLLDQLELADNPKKKSN